MRKSPELRRIAWIPRSGLRQNSRAACFPGAPLFVLTVIGVASFCHIGFAQSNLVLRSLEIPKSEIKQFDKRAVYLNDGTIVNWDEVLQAELPVGTKAEGGVPASQESFDHFLKTRGMPLFRIRHRLSIGDFASLSEMTEPLYEVLQGLPDSLEEARADYLICLGTMRARLHGGDRAGAILPFLRASDLRSRFSFDSGLPPEVELAVQQKDQVLSPLITPLFFDAEGARTQLALVGSKQLGEQQGGKIYWTALAICGGEEELAREWLSQLAEQDSNWVPILAAQVELRGAAGDRMEALRNPVWRAGLTRTQSIVADFLLGLAAQRIPADADQASLLFLKIAAASETVDRHMGSAALYQALLVARQNGKAREAEILKRELLDKYSETYHGRRVNAEGQQ